MISNTFLLSSSVNLYMGNSKCTLAEIGTVIFTVIDNGFEHWARTHNLLGVNNLSVLCSWLQREGRLLKTEASAGMEQAERLKHSDSATAWLDSAWHNSSCTHTEKYIYIYIISNNKKCVLSRYTVDDWIRFWTKSERNHTRFYFEEKTIKIKRGREREFGFVTHHSQHHDEGYQKIQIPTFQQFHHFVHTWSQHDHL